LTLQVRGFFDESDTNEPGEKAIFLIAGWVASVDLWERFTEDWGEVLDASPSISYFNHNEAKGQTGEFEGWNPADADEKILRLAKVISKHIDPRQHYGFITGMRKDLLKFILGKSPATPRQARSVLKFTSPSHWCLINTTACIAQIEREEFRREVPVDFVFDQGSDAYAECSKLIKKLKPLMPVDMSARIGTITEGNDKQIAPLQAADLLAGQAVSNVKTGKPDRPFLVLTKDQRVRFNPITTQTPHDSFLRGFAVSARHFNIQWSTHALEQARKKKG